MPKYHCYRFQSSRNTAIKLYYNKFIFYSSLVFTINYFDLSWPLLSLLLMMYYIFNCSFYSSRKISSLKLLLLILISFMFNFITYLLRNVNGLFTYNNKSETIYNNSPKRLLMSCFEQYDTFITEKCSIIVRRTTLNLWGLKMGMNINQYSTDLSFT